MFQLLKFWQLEKHITCYLEAVADYTTKRVKQKNFALKKLKLQLLIGLLLLNSAHLAFLCWCPLSEFARLLHFDVTLFWSAPQVINLLNTTMCLEIINVLYQSNWFYLHQKNNLKQSNSLEQNLFFPPLNLIRQVLLFNQDNTFLCKKWSFQKGISTMMFFHRYQTVFRLVNKSIIYFVFIVNFHYECCTVGYLFKYWKEFFQNEFVGIFYLFVLHINQMGVLLELNIGVAANVLVSELMFAFTTIALIRLKQANDLLKINGSRKWRKKGKLHLSPVLLQTFTQYHSQTVVLIFGSNKLLGGFILGFIATQLPLNSYYSLLILMGRFNAMATFVLTCIIVIQLVVIVGLHALAALFSFAIKSFAGRAYSWSSGSFGGKGTDLKVSLRLALYIERYDTANKRYGLTYGKISLGVISFASFGKFLLIYVEMLMYWYRFINDIK